MSVMWKCLLRGVVVMTTDVCWTSLSTCGMTLSTGGKTSAGEKHVTVIRDRTILSVISHRGDEVPNGGTRRVFD